MSLAVTLGRIAQIEQTFQTMTPATMTASRQARPADPGGAQFASALAQVAGTTETNRVLDAAQPSAGAGLDLSSLLSEAGIAPALSPVASSAMGGLTAGPAVSPLESYRLTSDYGHRGAIPEAGVGAMFHAGVDLAAPEGTDIRAPMAGTVTYSGWGHPTRGNTGWVVELTHLDGTQTMYNHMREESPLKVGTRVGAGEVIGEVGNTGNSSGPHVHLGTWVDGKHVDPKDYFAARGIELR